MIVIALICMTAILAGCGGTEPVSNQALSQPEASPVSAAPVSSAHLSPAAVSPAQISYLGDLDGDGLPTVGDAIRILRIVVGLDFDDTCADANKNDRPMSVMQSSFCDVLSACRRGRSANVVATTPIRHHLPPSKSSPVTGIQSGRCVTHPPRG